MGAGGLHREAGHGALLAAKDEWLCLSFVPRTPGSPPQRVVACPPPPGLTPCMASPAQPLCRSPPLGVLKDPRG